MEQRQKLQHGSSPTIKTKLLAGGIAGASETMTTYPFEFLKTLRQLPESTTSPRPSSISLLRSTVRNHGVPGLYAGCTALASSNALKSSIRFFAFSSSKDWLNNLKIVNATLATALDGITAGIAESVLVVTPAEALKTRMIEAGRVRVNHTEPGMVEIVRQIAREEGISAFWKGTAPVVGKQAVNFGVGQRWPGLAGRVSTTLAIGALSGVMTVYASMPFDNLKTRIQSARGQYTGLLDCAMKIAQKEGISAFWGGTTPRLIRLMLSSGITFTVYEQVVQFVSLRPGSQSKMSV
ncbi:mitochondrial carrier domain-containing protein [Aspergillus cavernicola]|uniref:Mitochondrial carrier domain-containing protein n=1 Tax=Aspergillus cavernicola TaxID=176166 RepID=A0ABR4IUL1_9EURO